MEVKYVTFQTNNSSTASDPQDDAPNLLQQPLAMGFYISTAETGPLPRWFWSACPENEFSPVKCFKVSWLGEKYCMQVSFVG